ncbi:unnamed protein product [Ixodes hexagonus]
MTEARVPYPLMLKSCSVKCCKESYRSERDMLYHPLPVQEPTRTRWLQAIGHGDNVSESVDVCSDHFPAEAYVYNLTIMSQQGHSIRKALLKPDAVPSLFLREAEHGERTAAVNTLRREAQEASAQRVAAAAESARRRATPNANAAATASISPRLLAVKSGSPAPITLLPVTPTKFMVVQADANRLQWQANNAPFEANRKPAATFRDQETQVKPRPKITRTVWTTTVGKRYSISTQTDFPEEKKDPIVKWACKSTQVNLCIKQSVTVETQTAIRTDLEVSDSENLPDIPLARPKRRARRRPNAKKKETASIGEKLQTDIRANSNSSTESTLSAPQYDAAELARSEGLPNVLPSSPKRRKQTQPRTRKRKKTDLLRQDRKPYCDADMPEENTRLLTSSRTSKSERSLTQCLGKPEACKSHYEWIQRKCVEIQDETSRIRKAKACKWDYK